MKKTKLFYLFLMFAAMFTVACDDDEDIALALSLEKNEVALMPTETENVKIVTGNGGYVAKSEDESIANATFEKSINALKVTALKSGETTIKVTDLKGKEAMLKVIVKAVLALEKDAVAVVENGEVTVAIKAGSGKYEVKSDKENIAKAVIEGTNVKISGVAKGEAIITVKDTDTNVEKTVKVTVKSALAVEKDNVTLVEGATEAIKILKGTGDYAVASDKADIAKVTLENNVITVKAIAKGEATITVTDKGTETTQNIKVTVKPALDIEDGAVVLYEGDTKEINIVKGTGKYAVTSSDDKVATASVDGSKVTIKAIAKGDATITVTDTDTNEKQEIAVTVKARLTIVKKELTINQGETERVAVINVVDNKYEIVTEPADVLKVEQGGTDYEGKNVDALVITPLKYNKEAVKVTVKSGDQEAVLMVTVNPVDMIKVDKKELALILGAKEEVRIIKGNGGYQLDIDKTDVVAAEVKLVKKPNQTPEYVVTVEAKAVGVANVKITDVAGKETTIKVTVKEGLKLAKKEISINQGETERVAVLNVTDNTYTIEVEPKGVLEVQQGGTDYEGKNVDALVITPLKYNKEAVKVTVKSGNQEAVLMVTVNPVETIKLKVNEISLEEGTKDKVKIIKGNGGYTLTIDKADVVAAKVELVKEHLTTPYYAVMLDAKVAGVANITITDEAGKTATLKVTVTKKPSANDLFNIDADGVVYKKEGAVVKGDIVIPEAGKAIAAYGADKTSPFSGNTEVTSIDFKNVTDLRQMSIYGCTNLKVVHLRKLEKFSGNGVFYGCSNLREVYCYMEDPSKVTFSNYTFNSTPKDKVLFVPKGTLAAYKASKFADFFTTIKEMEGGDDTPKPVDADVNIDENGLVFKKEGVELKGDLRIPDAGKTLAAYSSGEKTSPFAYEGKITSIDFNNVTNLKGSNCVSKCKDLTTVYLRKVTDIGSAFFGCAKLKKVYCYMEEPPYIPFSGRSSAFKGIDPDAVLYVPKGKIDAYKSSKLAPFFKNYKEIE